jgi:hypothetical protein
MSWGYRPLSVYRPFHGSAAKERLLVGGMGSGKTIAECADSVSRGLRVPGIRIVMTRKTVPEVRDTLEPEFINVMPDELYAACTVRRSGGHIESIVAPNGAEWLFRAVDDWQKYKSLNIGHIYWDELSEFDQATYNGMRGRLRQRFPTARARELGYNDEIPESERGSTAATNPAGHDWIWEHFIKDASPERQSWTATSLDNPHLPEDYLETLLQMPAAWVKRYVLCSFDEFGGLIYPDWNYDDHVWKGKLELSRLTPIWHGYDPGMRHPTGMLWVAVVGNKMVGVHNELAADTNLDAWVRRVKAVELRLPPVRWRVADPNKIHVRDAGSGVSLHRQWQRKGYQFNNGPSQHKDRIPMLGTLIKAKRFMVTTDCMQTFDQVQAYRWEDLTATLRQRLGSHAEEYAPEKPIKVYDDLVDAAQYLSSRWVTPMKDVTHDEEPDQTPWQQQSSELRRVLKKHQRGSRQRAAPGAGTIV